MTFTVDETALRDCVSALAATGARVVAGAAQAPPAVAPPRWASSDAADAAAGAAQDAATRLGSQIRGAADLVTACAEEYGAADDRAARRLRSVR
jgi:hypothetical protein